MTGPRDHPGSAPPAAARPASSSAAPDALSATQARSAAAPPTATQAARAPPSVVDPQLPPLRPVAAAPTGYSQEPSRLVAQEACTARERAAPPPAALASASGRLAGVLRKDRQERDAGHRRGSSDLRGGADAVATDPAAPGSFDEESSPDPNPPRAAESAAGNVASERVTGRPGPRFPGAVRLLSVASWLLALPLRGLVLVYQRLISPALPPACRYYPSCSRYAAEALAIHGPLRGSLLSLRRLLRCHPWCEGGIDPVPPRATETPARRHPQDQRQG